MAASLDKAFDKVGVWSPRTAHNVWCEENYDVTFYVAEFWNTITNIVYIINAVIGLRQTANDQPERRYFYTYLALLAVGLGSWSFHMTLRHTMQLMAVSLYSIWEVKSPPRTLNTTTAVCLLLITTVASVSSLLFDHAIYFQVIFGVYLSTYLVTCIRSIWTEDCNPSYMKVAGIWLILAFSVWIVDRNLCSQLRSVRYLLPLYVQPLLQLHALWHIFSNLACAFNILFVYDMRCRHLRYTTRKKIKYGLFPYLEVNVTQKDIP